MLMSLGFQSCKTMFSRVSLWFSYYHSEMKLHDLVKTYFHVQLFTMVCFGHTRAQQLDKFEVEAEYLARDHVGEPWASIKCSGTNLEHQGFQLLDWGRPSRDIPMGLQSWPAYWAGLRYSNYKNKVFKSNTLVMAYLPLYGYWSYLW